MKYSKLIIWIDSFNLHSTSLGVGQWLFRVVLFFCFLLGLAFDVFSLHGTQEFSSLTRDCTCALCGGSTVLTTGLTREAPQWMLVCYCWCCCHYPLREWEKLRWAKKAMIYRGKGIHFFCRKETSWVPSSRSFICPFTVTLHPSPPYCVLLEMDLDGSVWVPSLASS